MAIQSAAAALLAIAAGFLLPACVDKNSADARLRAHFHIPASVALDERSIREAILAIIPPGTPESVVSTKLAELGIGKDEMSRYYPPYGRGHATIRIEYDPAGFGIVKRHYGIRLDFDSGMKLVDVKVPSWLTGP